MPGSFYFEFPLVVNLPIKVMDSGKARKARSPNIKHAVKEKRKTVLFGLVQVERPAFPSSSLQMFCIATQLCRKKGSAVAGVGISPLWCSICHDGTITCFITSKVQ